MGGVDVGTGGSGGAFFLGCLKLHLKEQLPTPLCHTVLSAARTVAFVALLHQRRSEMGVPASHPSSLYGRWRQGHPPSGSSHNTSCVCQDSLGEDLRQNMYQKGDWLH